MDNGLLEFDAEKHREQLLKAEIKIDGCHYIVKKYESRIAEVNAEIAELAAIKKTLTNRLDSFEKSMLWILKERGLDAFPGVKYVLKRMERKKIVMTVDPDSQAFLALPTVVKRSYVWDKKAFDKEYWKNPEALGKYAREDKSEYIQFSLNRSID
jgi:hypothetical protein